MIFADKLIELRRKAGWTQEELAEKMNVSRQSIAKWEGAMSVPELAKMVKLSEIFGVSTDYLLKDDIEMITPSEGAAEDEPYVRVSMEEANAFLASRASAALYTLIGVALCILSPIPLMMLAAMSDDGRLAITEDAAAGIGLCCLFVMIALAVVLFVTTSNRNSCYEYLEKEVIETEYGVNGMVKERRAEFKRTYDLFNTIGVALCILSVVPLFVGICFDSGKDTPIVALVCLMLAIISVAVSLFIRVGVVWAGFEKLLQVGDYTKHKKKIDAALEDVSTAYWMIVLAIYLGISFVTGAWEKTWWVWPVAGVLYVALYAIVSAFDKKGKK